MPEKWTGTLIGKMHCNGVSFEELAEELGCTKGYVSMILNSKRKPPNAKERLESAYNNIISNRKETTEGA